MDQAWEAIAGLAADALAGAGVLFIELDPERHMEWFQPEASEIVAQLLHTRLVADRRMRIGTTSERVCGVHSALAMHVIQILGFQVIRLEVVIGNGPSRRYAAVVLYLSKVLLPQPEESCTVTLCVSTYVVVGVRMEWFAGVVSPDLLRLIFPFDVDGARIPVGFFARDIVAPLEQQDSLAQRSQSVGQRPTACAGADDDHVELLLSRHSSPPQRVKPDRVRQMPVIACYCLAWPPCAVPVSWFSCTTAPSWREIAGERRI